MKVLLQIGVLKKSSVAVFTYSKSLCTTLLWMSVILDLLKSKLKISKKNITMESGSQYYTRKRDDCLYHQTGVLWKHATAKYNLHACLCTNKTHGQIYNYLTQKNDCL